CAEAGCRKAEDKVMTVAATAAIKVFMEVNVKRRAGKAAAWWNKRREAEQESMGNYNVRLRRATFRPRHS
ncbi:MAG: hypothetical protein ACI802_003770, partial [Candidatus Paceibacteria bacterium]